MGADRTIAAARAAQTQGRTAPRARSLRADGHSVRAAYRHAMGAAAAGDGLRLRHDLLASAARLAEGGNLATTLGTLAQHPGPGRGHRLVQGADRFLLGPRRFWGVCTGPNPTDRAKNGSKRHVITDARGTPLAIVHTGANRNDCNMAIALVDAIPPIQGPRGRPRKRPDTVYADRGYDYDQRVRQPLRDRGIVPVIARKNTGHGSGLGVFRLFVESTHRWR